MAVDNLVQGEQLTLVAPDSFDRRQLNKRFHEEPDNELVSVWGILRETEVGAGQGILWRVLLSKKPTIKVTEHSCNIVWTQKAIISQPNTV